MRPALLPDRARHEAQPSASLLADRIHSLLLMDPDLPLRADARGERHDGRLLQPPLALLSDRDGDPAAPLLRDECDQPRLCRQTARDADLSRPRLLLHLQCLHLPHALRIHGDHDDIERNVFRSDEYQSLVRTHRAVAHLAHAAPLLPHAGARLRGALRKMDLPQRLLSLSEVDPEEQKVLLRHSPYAAISRFLRLPVALPALGERMLPPSRLRNRQAVQ